ncbi:DNA gyrase inhibitor YacG [Phenylobacterium sp.]|uniref:DNA gyrase inhibitor YacG n=1 Tax=Phenylobacterium sp. TaxID=1871053 RepID=UPI0011FED57A|nr:DNA gyrase inhibitor YacG [Phenylobacterium sp.]TAL32005.1 MAG: DNA gyrase inhibitor YacG [Phenylobacterium sp.]
MSGGRCPICAKPRVVEYRPFCSRRCADVDLQRWLNGSYAVPAEEDESGPGEFSDED